MASGKRLHLLSKETLSHVSSGSDVALLLACCSQWHLDVALAFLETSLEGPLSLLLGTPMAPWQWA